MLSDLASQSGHDFWLTRNGHGAGFWDRNYGAVGDRLTRECSPYGSAHLYVIMGDTDNVSDATVGYEKG